MADVFISYHNPDHDFALGLYQSLTNIKIDTFIDETRLIAGKNFDTQLYNELEQVRLVIIVIGDKTNTSEWVGKEIQYSLERQRNILPIRINKTSPCLEILENKHQPYFDKEKFHAWFYRQAFEQIGLIERNRIFLTEKQRQADLRLLKRFWSFVSTERINEIENKLQDHILEYVVWTETMNKYAYDRTLPENEFTNKILESAVRELDNALFDFSDELRKSAGSVVWHGEKYMMADYRLQDLGINPEERMDDELYQEKRSLYHEAMNLYPEVTERQAAVVAIIKSEYPEFVFSEGN